MPNDNSAASKKNKKRTQNRQQQKVGTGYANAVGSGAGQTRAQNKAPSQQSPSQNESVSASKKKNHYVDLFATGEDGLDAVVMLPGRNECDCEARKHALVNNCILYCPGRNECDCEARKHALVNNCMKCGRIVCVQEGSGPCMFCGQLVCTLTEMDILRTDSKKALELQQKFFTNPEHSKSAFSTLSAGFEKALAQKEKLLTYDRESARRTHVIDDQSDYYNFEQNPFLSTEQRENLSAKKEELLAQKSQSRRDKVHKIDLDFMGRQVTESDRISTQQTLMDEFDTETGTQRSTSRPTRMFESAHDATNPVKQFADMQFDSSLMQRQIVSQMPSQFSGRLQGDGASSVTDQGQCISVQQPFASLLVLGIKQHEGRSWYTAHRGRLWVAAGAKEPDPTYAHGIENMYTQLWNGSFMYTPLIGLSFGYKPQYLYFKYPNGECEDAYVLILEGARELSLHLPVRGRPGLFQLDITNLTAAQNILYKTAQASN